MSNDLIKEIRKDRETGTSGPWVAKKSAFEVFNVDHGSMKYEITADLTLIAALYSSDIDANARRIARVPAMEDALTAQAAEIERLRQVLEWYGEQARLARLIHSEGDKGRHALAGDGGKRARAALSKEGE